MKKCLYCGADVAENRRTFCSRKCAGLYRQNYKKCVVCGKMFKAAPSEPTCCCSPECSRIHRAALHNAGVYDDSVTKFIRARDAYTAAHQGELHHIAKRWVLLSPDGKIYECVNLLNFIRDNADLFDGTVRQAWDGISKIKYSMQGKRKNPSYQWKGWRLIEWGD